MALLNTLQLQNKTLQISNVHPPLPLPPSLTTSQVFQLIDYLVDMLII